MMAAKRGKVGKQLIPDLADGDAIGKLAGEFRGTRPFAQSRKEFDRQPVHCAW